jgi:predicted ATP-grasp superfamily ATP-dependent carboligase
VRVLITDGDTRQALATARSLGLKGHDVVVHADRSPSLGGISRYCSMAGSGPAAYEDPEGFVTSIVELARQQEIDLLLPMTEVSTLLLTCHRDRLPPSCHLPFPAYDSVRQAGNKAEVLDLAQKLGVPVPDSVTLESPKDLDALTGALSYPLVVKPARSRVLTSSGWLSNSVSYASDVSQLRERLSALAPEAYPVLLQERIVGAGVGVFVLCDRGKPVAHFAHRRLREKPPSGGVSVLCESTQVDPVVAHHVSRLVQVLEWHGPAMVEFKRDGRDGSLRLMEINGRFWGSLQLAIDAGVDFPALLVDMARGCAPAEPPQYRMGVRCRWLAGDLDSLLLILLKDRAHLNLPPGHPGRLRTLWSFLQFWDRQQRLELERRDDLGPAWLEWRRRLLPG